MCVVQVLHIPDGLKELGDPMKLAISLNFPGLYRRISSWEKNHQLLWPLAAGYACALAHINVHFQKLKKVRLLLLVL